MAIITRLLLLFTLLTAFLVASSDAASVQCGISAVTSSANNRRIVGGHEAKPHQLPWMVRVNTEAVKVSHGTSSAITSRLHFYCGGSLISDRWILTAGHCAVTPEAHALEGYHMNLSSTQVILGATNLSNAQETGRLIPEIAGVYVHEHFALKHLEGSLVVENDLTLIKLKEPVDFEVHRGAIAPICLPSEQMVVSKSDCQIAGWGRVHTNEKNHGPLKYADVQLLSAAECNSLRGAHKHPLTDANVCAGYRDHHTCRGDSGGDLGCRSSSNPNQWILVGVDSFGPKICESNAPSMFVNVVKQLAWIEATMRAHANN